MASQAENPIRLARPEAGRIDTQRTQTLLTVGGVLGALAASSCCVVPLVLFGLGISGAWIVNLTQLAPYQPYFVAATAASLGAGYWLVYRSGRIACADGLFVTDQRQRIVNWSSAAQRVLGYSPEEVVGQPCYRVLMGRELDGHPVCRRECQVTANARRGPS